MAGSVTCLRHGCRRKVSADSEWGYYCFDHRMDNPDYAEILVGAVESANLQGYQEPSMSVDTNIGFNTELIQAGTPLSPDLSDAYVQSAEEWNREDNRTIPQVAGSRHQDAHEEFRDLMVQNGVDDQRIEVVEVKGIHRMVPLSKSSVQSDHRIHHKVLVVDQDTPHETVIDPTIAMFAPVRNTDEPVEDQLESGATPFGDSPWIGSREEYVRGDHMWWDSVQ